MVTLSAHQFLSGPGFDENFMLEKAIRELGRVKSCQDALLMYDHMINFSVTIASIADWTFHLRLTDQPKWSVSKETHFSNWIRSQSPEVAAFIDISNECKHANRKCSNYSANSLDLAVIFDISLVPEQSMKMYEQKGFGRLTEEGRIMYFIPTLTYCGNKKYFYDVAEAALIWWKNINLDHAIPLDKCLKPI
ncbi:hypothetical protein [Deefgea piscis]|uniref:hypothetical protein n=1 Tax=Deefgea piscis TaxID=2739061 RepID=UPI001C7F130C|nr:hypothetical protein [Deefgea piscis]QZA82450.1 hypothetical protein K4H25_07395 [Deefgea piscis]